MCSWMCHEILDVYTGCTVPTVLSTVCDTGYISSETQNIIVNLLLSDCHSFLRTIWELPSQRGEGNSCMGSSYPGNAYTTRVHFSKVF